MSINLPSKATKQFNPIEVILNDKSQKARLQTYIDETVKCKQRILDENESIKGLREQAVQELGINPKLYNSLVSLYFNNDFEQKKEELEQFETAINALMQVED